ncbi:MAG: hypothetical protein ABI321_23320 [Polyangia bacterium]
MSRPDRTLRAKIAFLALTSMLLTGGLAHAGDFVDTRLNFTLVNENVLVKPGQTTPSVPGWRFGQPSQLGILFFENYDTRYTGYENLTHLVVYKKVETARVVFEAAYVLRLLQFTDVNLSSIDDGSYVRMQYFFDRTRTSKLNVAFTAFPLNADRMRLGYSWRISWGGSPIFFKYNPDLPIGAAAFVTNTAPSPGAKLQISDERWYAYVGAKSSTLLDRNPSVNEQVAVWGAVFGAGADAIKNHLRIETNGGYFNRGTNPLFFGTTIGPQGQTFKSYPVRTFGATLQVSAFNHISPTTSIDTSLYRNDPQSAARYFNRPIYQPGFNWLASAEWTMTGSSLQDADKLNTTKLQLAYAGDINLRAQIGNLRLTADFEVRSLAYILQNQPSLVPYQDFPQDGKTTPELFGSVGFDYWFQRVGMRLGLTVGVQNPASFKPGANGVPGALLGTASANNVAATIVVRNEGDLSILPDSTNRLSAKPIFGTKLQAREDFLEWFAVIGQVYYEYDANLTHLTKAQGGESIRNYNYPHRLGFTFTLQARY